MAQDYSKWWNKFKYQADVVVGKRSHYYKEKYGGFRVELYEGFNDCIADKLIEIENESYKCCQRCAKHRKQFWKEWGWVEHFCLPCYIIVMTKCYWKRFIYKIQMLGRKIN